MGIDLQCQQNNGTPWMAIKEVSQIPSEGMEPLSLCYVRGLEKCVAVFVWVTSQCLKSA